jgi:hypothetical protein
MTDQPTPTCATCRFCVLAECRRNPPVAALGPECVNSYWPDVDPTDWCGEHEPAAPAKPDAGARALDLLSEIGKLADKQVCEWVKVNPCWPERVLKLLRESGEGAK